jgi:SulP family sulfate permease
LFPKGSLFFAGASEFEENLPEVGDAQGMVVILRLRGRNEIGSTFLRVIDRYAKSIQANHGKLILVGVSKQVYTQLQKTGLLDVLGSENVYRATSIMGDSSITALEDARQWLEASKTNEPTES